MALNRYHASASGPCFAFARSLCSGSVITQGASRESLNEQSQDACARNKNALRRAGAFMATQICFARL